MLGHMSALGMLPSSAAGSEDAFFQKPIGTGPFRFNGWTLGETLRTGLRSYDLALRYGGDEFVCILPGFGVVEAEARFGAIQAKLAQGPVPVSVTFGIAEWRPGEDTDALLTRADAALYEVRRALRGGDGSRDDPPDDDATSAVAAHRLLNSSAVVSMAATTLLAQWDDMPAPDRIHLLERVLRHASKVDDHLRGVTRGHLAGERLTTGCHSFPPGRR